MSAASPAEASWHAVRSMISGLAGAADRGVERLLEQFDGAVVDNALGDDHDVVVAARRFAH